MLTAKEANKLAEEYAFSERWFCDKVLDAVEKNAKYGMKELRLEDYCNYSEGFNLHYLERLKELGYKTEFIFESSSLIISW